MAEAGASLIAAEHHLIGNWAVRSAASSEQRVCGVLYRLVIIFGLILQIITEVVALVSIDKMSSDALIIFMFSTFMTSLCGVVARAAVIKSYGGDGLEIFPLFMAFFIMPFSFTIFIFTIFKGKKGVSAVMGALIVDAASMVFSCICLSTVLLYNILHGR
jgi:hypothetical protein